MDSVDLCIKANHVLNVFSRRFEPNQLWIKNGKIVATGNQNFLAKETLDYQDQFIVPGFIDSHVHVESSLLVPSELAKVILPKGTTSIFTDPHEIANVLGISGIEYMIKDARQTPLDVFVMLSSSVPATPFEDNGATLNAEDLAPLYDEPEVKGLAEVMDYPAVERHDPQIMAKINDALKRGYQVDGHGAGLNRTQLDVYRQVGISTDHECTTAQQMYDRLEAGFHLFLREGTVERDLQNTIQVVNEGNAQRFSFCTDDKFVNTLLDEGGIDFCIKLAMRYGIRPETAFTMASYNAAQSHQINDLGALTTGYQADLVVMGNPYKVDVNTVIKAGHVITSADYDTKPLPGSTNTMNQSFQASDLELPLTGDHPECNVIGIEPNHINTDHLIEYVPVENGLFKADVDHDILKMVSIERHHHTGKTGVALVHGFKLTEGAVATTISHDSHNLLAVGTSDEAIKRAIDSVIDAGGGISVVDNHKILATMPLPVAGLMSNQSYQVASQQLSEIEHAYRQISHDINFDPFITLSFLSLAVIPTIKLTDRGLYDFEQQKFIPVQVN